MADLSPTKSPPLAAPSFDELSRTYHAALHRLARGYEARADKQDDLVQEILIALHRALPSFEGRASVRTWVHRIAHNVAVDHVRRERRGSLAQTVTLDELEASADPRADTARIVDHKRKVERLAELVRTLRPLDRQVVLLHLEGMDPQEIADVTGLTPENVATKAHRIKRALATALGGAT